VSARGSALVGDILKAPPSADTIICEGCDAVAELPPVGLPEGWDGVWHNVAGWICTCPRCLDRAEAIFRGGAPIAKPGAALETGHER
jgi:hypothetical protein